MSKDLKTLKISELKEMANEQNIDVKGLKKDEIIAALSGKTNAPKDNIKKNNDIKSDKIASSRPNRHSNKSQNNSADNGNDNDESDDADNGRPQSNLRRRERGNNRNSKYSNNRDRNRNNREEESYGEDEMMPIAGIVDILDNFGFVRTSGYAPQPNDVFISGSVIKKYGLRSGDAIVGTAIDKLSRFGENIPKKAPKFNPLDTVEQINGLSVEESLKRPKFANLTALYPTERLTMELPIDGDYIKASKTTRNTGRLIDTLSPIGKGQRALIVAPPKAGKTIMMQNIANSISANNPEVHLMVVLVDERPEEVTDMQRSVKGEVISSTFDKPASEHTSIAELAIERAKRLVEQGKDVVILLDSITRLARAYNYVAPTSGRVLSGGVDAAALYPPKKFLGAARNVEEGGSLTIIASALVETGSKMDEVIFEEFKGTGNSEIKLSRELADKRIFPAIDVNASGTRREEWLLDAKELQVLQFLHRGLGDLEPLSAIELLLKKFDETKTNFEFLVQVSKTMPHANANGASS